MRTIGKRECRDKERQSREEPGRETTEVPRGFAALCVRVQIVLRRFVCSRSNCLNRQATQATVAPGGGKMRDPAGYEVELTFGSSIKGGLSQVGVTIENILTIAIVLQ